MESLEHLMRTHPFMAELRPPHVAFLAGCARNVRLPAGQLLFREGEPADALFLIREGAVALEIHDAARGTRQLESLGAGDAVGWSWLFPPYRWHVDGRAMDDVRVFVLDGECLRKKLEQDHELGYAVLKRLLFDLHQRLERARLQRLDVYAPPRAP